MFDSDLAISDKPFGKARSSPSWTGTSLGLTSHPWGHATIEHTRDGVEKPANSVEIAFYQAASRGELGLQSITPSIAEYSGVRTRPGCATPPPHVFDPNHPASHDSNKALVHPQILILEDLAGGFAPDTLSSMDFKIGTTHYAPGASETSKANNIRIAENSTTRSHGIRLMGAKIVSVQGNTHKVDSLDKAYGFTIRTDEETPSSTLEPTQHPTWGYTMVRLFPGMEHESLGSPLGSLPNSISHETVGSQLRQVDKSIFALSELSSQAKDIKDGTAPTMWRFPGASLLVLYGEPATAQENDSLGRANPEARSVFGSGEPSDTVFKVRAKLIDFAKAHPTPDQGPDHGVIMGCESLLRLANTRKRTLLSQRSWLAHQLLNSSGNTDIVNESILHS